MTKSSEVLRILDRYLTEIIETYELCPWARTARLDGELAVAVIWGAPELDTWVAAARELLSRPGTRVAMVVAPELAIAPPQLRAVRDAVAAALPDAGVADFHPDAVLDLATPARLVPYLRRAPDPLLQLVPLAILDALRSGTPAIDRTTQAQMLGGHAAPARADIADRIAVANHATATAHADAIAATFDAIDRDRSTAYTRLGISTGRRP